MRYIYELNKLGAAVLIGACVDNAVLVQHVLFICCYKYICVIDHWALLESVCVCVCVRILANCVLQLYSNNVFSHSVSHHVNMKVIVAMAIERLLHRPNIGQRAQ